MSFARVERLEKWLADVLKVPTENFSVSLEQGNAVGYFDDVELFSAPAEPAAEGDFSLESAGIQMDFGMRDTYVITVKVRNHGADPKKLKAGLLRWLFNEKQGGAEPELTYDGEKNNQSTYDWFFDLKIEDRTQNVGAELRTC